LSGVIDGDGSLLVSKSAWSTTKRVTSLTSCIVIHEDKEEVDSRRNRRLL
jgi:hypothetical protein